MSKNKNEEKIIIIKKPPPLSEHQGSSLEGIQGILGHHAMGSHPQ